jgi:hypothetical protein
MPGLVPEDPIAAMARADAQLSALSPVNPPLPDRRLRR